MVHLAHQDQIIFRARIIAEIVRNSHKVLPVRRESQVKMVYLEEKDIQVYQAKTILLEAVMVDPVVLVILVLLVSAVIPKVMAF